MKNSTKDKLKAWAIFLTIAATIVMAIVTICKYEEKSRINREISKQKWFSECHEEHSKFGCESLYANIHRKCPSSNSGGGMGMTFDGKPVIMF